MNCVACYELFMLNAGCVFEGCLVALHWKTVGGMWDGSSVICGNCCDFYDCNIVYDTY